MENSNEMKIQIFLDLDGIIRDFVAGCINLFDLDNCTHEDITGWGVIGDIACKKYGLSNDGFWESMPSNFFEHLPKTEHAEHVLALMRPLNPTILTTPSPNGAGSTQRWIRRELPDFFNKEKYLIGPDKSSCAHSGSLLIDDSDENCINFTMNGGDVITFPRPWNKIGKTVKNPIDYLTKELQARSLME